MKFYHFELSIKPEQTDNEIQFFSKGLFCEYETYVFHVATKGQNDDWFYRSISSSSKNKTSLGYYSCQSPCSRFDFSRELFSLTINNSPYLVIEYRTESSLDGIPHIPTEFILIRHNVFTEQRVRKELAKEAVSAGRVKEALSFCSHSVEKYAVIQYTINETNRIPIELLLATRIVFDLVALISLSDFPMPEDVQDIIKESYLKDLNDHIHRKANHESAKDKLGVFSCASYWQWLKTLSDATLLHFDQLKQQRIELFEDAILLAALIDDIDMSHFSFDVPF